MQVAQQQDVRVTANRLGALFATATQLTHPQGRTVQELRANLANMGLEVEARTVQRYLQALEEVCAYPIYVEDGPVPRYRLVTGGGPPALPPMQLSLGQAAQAVAWLGAAIRRNPQTEGLRAVAEALLPSLPSALRDALHNHIDESSSKVSPDLEVLAQGWALRRKVLADYTDPQGTTRALVLHVYGMEQHEGVLHVWAFVEEARDRNLAGRFRTLSLARLSRTRLAADAFTPQAGYDNTPVVYEDAWGVVTEEPLVTVSALFAAEIATEVAASTAHPSQAAETLADGRLELTWQVSGTGEIKRFLRSWGPEAEVLAPASLREELAAEAAALCARYAAPVEV